MESSIGLGSADSKFGKREDILDEQKDVVDARVEVFGPRHVEAPCVSEPEPLEILAQSRKLCRAQRAPLAGPEPLQRSLDILGRRGRRYRDRYLWNSIQPYRLPPSSR